MCLFISTNPGVLLDGKLSKKVGELRDMILAALLK
jgi:hypothetical protein